MEQQEAIVTMYSVLEDHEIIGHSFARHLEDTCIRKEPKEDGTIVFTLHDDSQIIMKLRFDQAYIQSQVTGMVAFYDKIEMKNECLKQDILTQISMFTCITSFQFLLNEDENRTSFLMGTIFETAQDSASIVLYPSMSLFTPKGELLISIEGESDVEVWHPIAHQSVLGMVLQYTKEDERRYHEVMEELKQSGYPTVSYMLSTQMNQDALDVPEQKEIAKRAIALFACAVCAEGTVMEDGSKEIGLEEFTLIDDRYHCRSWLSEEEKAFIEQGEDEQAVQLTWRYESCAVLLWALGLYEIDDSFTQLCDVAHLAEIIRSFPSLDALCLASKRRSDEELLDYHTRVLYYDWSCVEARIHGETLKGVETGVIQEHHMALNWLCNANDTRSWDEITTNT